MRRWDVLVEQYLKICETRGLTEATLQHTARCRKWVGTWSQPAGRVVGELIGVYWSAMAKDVVRLDADADLVVNQANLERVKRLILESGRTCTYCNMYNDNPAWETARFLFYLNPDPGGPHGHPQFNIGCDPRLGDFRTLVIRRRLGAETTPEEFQDQYRSLDFRGGREIVMRLEADVPEDRAWDLPRQAIPEALESLERG